MQSDGSRHSREIEDLITAPPSWMLKWGVMVFLVVLAVLSVLSFYIRYPDVVKGHLVVQSSGGGFNGRLDIGQAEVAQIRKGQRVVVKLHRYPVEDFGVVQGVIDTVSDSPGNTGYFMVTVIFKTPLPSGIVLTKRLTADAEVMLQDRSLMERLLSGIRGRMGAK